MQILRPFLELRSAAEGLCLAARRHPAGLHLKPKRGRREQSKQRVHRFSGEVFLAPVPVYDEEEAREEPVPASEDSFGLRWMRWGLSAKSLEPRWDVGTGRTSSSSAQRSKSGGRWPRYYRPLPCSRVGGSSHCNPYVIDSWPFEPNVLAARARKSECFVNLSAQSGGLEAPSRNMRLRSVPPNLNHWEEGDDEDDDVDEDLDEASGPGSCVPSAWG